MGKRAFFTFLVLVSTVTAHAEVTTTPLPGGRVDSTDGASGFSVGPGGFQIGTPRGNGGSGVTVQNGVISFDFSLTGSAGGQRAPARTAPIILPAYQGPSPESQLTPSDQFFKSVGATPPAPPGRHPLAR